MTYDRTKRNWDNTKKNETNINYNYDEFASLMRENGYTTHSIKTGQEKSNIINSYTFNKITKNSASIGLDILATLMDDMEIEKLEIVKNGDILSVKIPTNVIINKNH